MSNILQITVPRLFARAEISGAACRLDESGARSCRRLLRRRYTVRSAYFVLANFSTALAGAFICRPILPALNRIFSKFFAEESIEVLNVFFIPIGEQPPCT